MNINFDQIISFLQIDSLHLALENSIKLEGDFDIEKFCIIIAKLKSHERLLSLDLSDLNIGDQGVQEIAQLLENNKYLETLNLSNNNIGAKGVSALLKAIKSNNVLKSLNLSQNKLRVGAIKAIAEFLKENRVLADLNLSGNKIATEGIKILIGALHLNTGLTSLDLSSTGIKSVKKIAKIIDSNRALVKLIIHDISIGKEGEKSFIKALKKNNRPLA